MYFSPVRSMDEYCDWTGVSQGRIDSVWGNIGHFWVLTASNCDAFWPSFHRYCLLNGPKGNFLDIESACFALVGSRHVCYGHVGNSYVGFCLF